MLKKSAKLAPLKSPQSRLRCPIPLATTDALLRLNPCALVERRNGRVPNDQNLLMPVATRVNYNSKRLTGRISRRRLIMK